MYPPAYASYFKQSLQTRIQIFLRTLAQNNSFTGKVTHNLSINHYSKYTLFRNAINIAVKGHVNIHLQLIYRNSFNAEKKQTTLRIHIY